VDQSALWLALLATACSAVVGTVTVSLKAYSRSRLTEMLDEDRRAGDLLFLTERRMPLQLSMSAIRASLNLLILLLLLYFVEQQFAGVNRYVVAFLAAGLLVSIFGVAAPTSIAQYHAERIVAWATRPLRVIDLLARPFLALLHWIDPVVRRVTGVPLSEMNGADLSDEIRSVVEDREEEGAVVDEAQKEMLEAVFEFPLTTVGGIMTPRTDIVGIEISMPLDEIKAVILDKGHSRIPVYEENIDNILGILYAKDLLRYVGVDEPFELRRVLRDALLVPESKPLGELLSEFKQNKVHLAMVLDEYGGTAGLVTIEDIVEEIVGEIQDEYETVEAAPSINLIDDRVAEVEARAHMDDVNDELDLDLPEDEDYETIGGFVFSKIGHIPEAGESFDYGPVRLTVIEAERTRVVRVRIERLDSAEGSGVALAGVGTSSKKNGRP